MTPEPGGVGTPGTEAGRAFLAYWRDAVNANRTGIDDWPDADVVALVRRFLAIEAEATRAVLDIAIEEAERLRSGLILAGDAHGEETLAEFAMYLRGLRS